mgnify:FL=1
MVTAPTNGAAGVIPAVLKVRPHRSRRYPGDSDVPIARQYVLEFISDAPERDVKTFLLTAAGVCHDCVQRQG